MGGGRVSQGLINGVSCMIYKESHDIRVDYTRMFMEYCELPSVSSINFVELFLEPLVPE